MSSSTLIIFLLSIIGSTIIIASPAEQNSPQDFVDAHNRARTEVGVRPLVWNDTVAKYATQFAHQRQKDCEMEPPAESDYGINQAEGLDRLSAVDAVGMWVSEKPFYDHKSNSCVGGEECLHYTQVVWNESTQLGCARKKCPNGWLFVVCFYYPPGNYVGTPPY